MSLLAHWSREVTAVATALVVLVLIISARSLWTKRKGTPMPIPSRAQQMDAGYLIEGEQDGRKVDLHLFARWSGYEHPIQLQNALRVTEALRADGFCVGFFGGSPDGPQLVRVEAFRAQRTPFQQPTSLPENTIERYFEIVTSKDGFKAGKELTAVEAMQRREFIYFRPKENGDAAKSEMVKLRLVYSYEYTYKPDGALGKLKVSTEDGRVNILDY